MEELNRKIKLLAIGIVKKQNDYDCQFTKAIFAFNGISYYCNNPKCHRCGIGCYPTECKENKKVFKRKDYKYGTPQIAFV